MKNTTNEPVQTDSQAQDNSIVINSQTGEIKTRDEKRSKIFAVNVQTPETNAALHEKLNQIPGDSMSDKLTYCLNAGLEAAALIPQHQNIMRDIRLANKRTEDIILGVLQKTNAANEDALAQKNAAITILQNDLDRLRKTVSNQAEQISAITMERNRMAQQINTLTEELAEKEQLVALLREQMETQAAGHEQMTVLIQRLSALEKVTSELKTNLRGEQIAFPNLGGSR